MRPRPAVGPPAAGPRSVAGDASARPDAPVEVRVIDDESELLVLAAEWDELAASGSARFFTRPYWCLSWWRTLGRGELLVATARAGDRLVALAPLFVQSRALRVVRFLGHHVGAVSEVLVAPGYEHVISDLWGAVLGPRRTYLDLVDYADGGGGLAALTECGGTAVDVTRRDVCPYVAVSGTYDSYWQGRSSELRRILRRAHRAIERRGASFRIEVVQDWARAQDLLPELTTTFDAAERHNPRQHLLAPPYAAFTRRLMEQAAGAGALRLFVGWVDEHLAAFALAFGSAHDVAMWLNRFDPEYGDISPGHLVSEAMVQFGFEHGVDRVDFLLGEGRYKRLWCTDATDALLVTGARRRPTLRVGHAAATLRRTAGRLRRSVRSLARRRRA